MTADALTADALTADALTALALLPETKRAVVLPTDTRPLAQSRKAASAPAAPRTAPHVSGFPRFCNWIGNSGQRYIVTVYAPENCPEIEDALALAVRRDHQGRREILAVADCGTFPALALYGAAFAAAREAGANEIHLHMLTLSREARERIARDLTGRALREGVA